MTSVSKNVFIDKLDDIINKYNNEYYKTVKMKPVDVKSNTYIESSKEINNKNPKFKIGDIVKISKHKNIFVKGYVPNWSEDVFVIKKVKTFCFDYWLLLVILKADKLLRHFTKNDCKKQIKKSLELSK